MKDSYRHIAFILLFALLSCQSTTKPDVLAEEEGNNEEASQNEEAVDEDDALSQLDQGSGADFEDELQEDNNKKNEAKAEDKPPELNSEPTPPPLANSKPTEPTPAPQSKANAKTEVAQDQAVPVPTAPAQATLPAQATGAPLKLKGTLKDLAPGEAPDEYVVQSGDTLFDICDQLIDEGEFWPMLWSLNPSIKNPHVIWPGMRLRFYRGDQATPPALEISSSDQELVLESDAEYLRFLKEKFGPGGTIKTEQVEFISPDQIKKTDIIEDVHFFKERDKSLVLLPGFVSEDELKGECIVGKGVNGEGIISQDAQFTCHSMADGFGQNRRYSVVRLAQKVFDRNKQMSGYLYQHVAQVHVEKKLATYAIGTAKEVRLDLTAGDILIPYRSNRVYVAMTEDGPVTRVSADIIAFDDQDRKLGGSGQMVFISKGERAGVNKGQIMKIYENGDLEDLAFIGEVVRSDLDIGAVKIIDTSAVGAIGLVLRNRKEIQVGDRLGRF